MPTLARAFLVSRWTLKCMQWIDWKQTECGDEASALFRHEEISRRDFRLAYCRRRKLETSLTRLRVPFALRWLITLVNAYTSAFVYLSTLHDKTSSFAPRQDIQQLPLRTQSALDSCRLYYRPRCFAVATVDGNDKTSLPHNALFLPPQKHWIVWANWRRAIFLLYNLGTTAPALGSVTHLTSDWPRFS